MDYDIRGWDLDEDDEKPKYSLSTNINSKNQITIQQPPPPSHKHHVSSYLPLLHYSKPKIETKQKCLSEIKIVEVSYYPIFPIHHHFKKVSNTLGRKIRKNTLPATDRTHQVAQNQFALPKKNQNFVPSFFKFPQLQTTKKIQINQVQRQKLMAIASIAQQNQRFHTDPMKDRVNLHSLSVKINSQIKKYLQ